MRFLHGLAIVALVASSMTFSRANELERVREETLRPYQGPISANPHRQTLTGKIVCGYQGWFTAEGDGAEFGWFHWSKDRQRPGLENIKIDLWPDMTELGPEERFATDFRHADGRVAEVFSSFRQPTVLRHFRWMQEYGIDGAFVQRFAVSLRDPRFLRLTNTVLAHCREGANRSARSYAVMYDLTGLGPGRMAEVMEDWRALRRQMRLTEDGAYLQHRGRPVVAVWGVGFDDRRKYTLAECEALIRFLKDDPEVGGCTVVLGVPSFWRTLDQDAVTDADLHRVLQLADVVSPWTVGRISSPEQAAEHGVQVWRPDLAWCRERRLDFLPVVFPGFSWHRMHGGPLEEIPRRQGEFLWSQLIAARQAGAEMIYVAMFDEVDEATAIFKCTDHPPGGPATFLGMEGLPADFYLRLTGQGGRLLRGELPADAPLPR